MAYTFSQTGAEIQNILNLARTQIAAPYSTATIYVVGDYCTRNGVFYKCKSNTTGTWTSSKWEALTVAEALSFRFEMGTGAADLESGTWTYTSDYFGPYPPGLYLIEFGGAFTTNATGYRTMGVNTSSSSFSPSRYTPSAAAFSGANTKINHTTLYEITSTSTFYLWAYQNSGSQLTVNTYMRVLKIK